MDSNVIGIQFWPCVVPPHDALPSYKDGGRNGGRGGGQGREGGGEREAVKEEKRRRVEGSNLWIKKEQLTVDFLEHGCHDIQIIMV